MKIAAPTSSPNGETPRARVSVVLVHPENPMNVGSVARALANMAIMGGLDIVGTPDIITPDAFRTAKHAAGILEGARFFRHLQDAIDARAAGGRPPVTIALTARSGSPDRPHPLEIREAARAASRDLSLDPTSRLVLVFGAEGSGLANEDVARCQRIATIPSPSAYSVLNLAQACLLSCWEVNRALIDLERDRDSLNHRADATQRLRLITEFIGLAEAAGFIHPGDPHKLRPRLEGIFSALPQDQSDVKTLHGLVAQIRRNLVAMPTLQAKRRKGDER